MVLMYLTKLVIGVFTGNLLDYFHPEMIVNVHAMIISWQTSYIIVMQISECIFNTIMTSFKNILYYPEIIAVFQSNEINAAEQ